MTDGPITSDPRRDIPPVRPGVSSLMCGIAFGLGASAAAIAAGFCLSLGMPGAAGVVGAIVGVLVLIAAALS